jgi:hypothetical protein
LVAQQETPQILLTLDKSTFFTRVNWVGKRYVASKVCKSRIKGEYILTTTIDGTTGLTCNAGVFGDASGNVLVTNVAGLGYGTGSGGTVTQATSRTTAVTINKPTGKITMFTAAGSATPNTFTVNNSLVAATDAILINLAGGNTNVYYIFATGIGAGSFVITFWTTGGTASDTPVINFSVIKGSQS